MKRMYIKALKKPTDMYLSILDPDTGEAILSRLEEVQEAEQALRDAWDNYERAYDSYTDARKVADTTWRKATKQHVKYYGEELARYESEQDRVFEKIDNLSAGEIDLENTRHTDVYERLVESDPTITMITPNKFGRMMREYGYRPVSKHFGKGDTGRVWRILS